MSVLSQFDPTPSGRATVVTKGDGAPILGRMLLFEPQRTLRMLGATDWRPSPSRRNQPSSAKNTARGSGQKVYPFARNSGPYQIITVALKTKHLRASKPFEN
jgi:hypothetical protein